MKNYLYKYLVAPVGAVALTATLNAENSFKEISGHLDLDGPFIAYMNFDGDGQAIGEKLNTIYQEFAAGNPQVPPFPLDFPQIFDALGFGSVRAIGMSSHEFDDGLVRNKSVTLLDGEPTGLIGMATGDPIRFDLAKRAPADASTVFSGYINLSDLKDSIHQLAGLVMGPMGQGMMQQGLMQPVPGTDVTGDEVIAALSGRVDLIMAQDFSQIDKPVTNLWVQFDGAGPVAERLEAMMLAMGIVFEDGPNGRTANLSPLMDGAPMGLYVQLPSGSDDLVLYTDAAWVAGFEAAGSLADSAAYKRVAGKLPQEAMVFAYSAGFDLKPILATFEGKADIAPFLPLAEGLIDLVIGDLLKPNASASYLDGDAMVTEQYAEYSYKEVIVALPAGIGAGVGVAAAIKAQQEAAKAAEAGEAE